MSILPAILLLATSQQGPSVDQAPTEPVRYRFGQATPIAPAVLKNPGKQCNRPFVDLGSRLMTILKPKEEFETTAAWSTKARQSINGYVTKFLGGPQEGSYFLVSPFFDDRALAESTFDADKEEQNIQYLWEWGTISEVTYIGDSLSGFLFRENNSGNLFVAGFPSSIRPGKFYQGQAERKPCYRGTISFPISSTAAKDVKGHLWPYFICSLGKCAAHAEVFSDVGLTAPADLSKMFTDVDLPCLVLQGLIVVDTRSGKIIYEKKYEKK